MATTTATPTVEAKATLRYLGTSPTKVRPLLNLIRGISVEHAERILQLTPRGAGDDVLKLLESAVANAANLHAVEPEELFVKVCFADEGPTRSHGRPRARGRFFKTRKRSTHITIVVARYNEAELELRRRNAESSSAPVAASRRSRTERVKKSRAAAAGHDHDHDHDHAEEIAADASIDEAEEPTTEATEAIDGEETE